MKDPTYPVFAAKVAVDLVFRDKPLADVMFLRFDDIFNMFHMRRLQRTMVRLFVLSMAHQVMKENTASIAIVDPYYMISNNFRTPEGRHFMTEHIEEIMVEHKTKNYILFPYFPK